MTEAHDLAVTLKAKLPPHTFRALIARVKDESPEARLETLRYVLREWKRASSPDKAPPHTAGSS